MTPSQQLARARTCVQKCFAEQTQVAAPEFRESIFVCDGFYRGRRFRAETISAVWFAEEDELKIHSANGECLASYNSNEMAELAAAEHAASVRADVLPMRVAEETPVESQPVRRAA